MFISVLAPFESLEQYRGRLMSLINRPVYVIGGELYDSPISSTFYRADEQSPYRKLEELDLFLSILRWHHTDGYMSADGVVREYGKANSKARACTLAPSHYRCLAYPITKLDQIKEDIIPGSFGVWNEKDKVRYKDVGLHLGNILKIPVNPGKVPAELLPYVRQMPSEYDQSKIITGIMFALSNKFEAPLVIKNNWSLGPDAEIPIGNKLPTWIIHAPGQYALFPHMKRDSYCQYAIGIREPGACVVCHGNSGDKVHFGAVNASPELYLDGILCRVCFKKASGDWIALMNSIESI